MSLKHLSWLLPFLFRLDIRPHNALTRRDVDRCLAMGTRLKADIVTAAGQARTVTTCLQLHFRLYKLRKLTFFQTGDGIQRPLQRDRFRAETCSPALELRCRQVEPVSRLQRPRH